MNKGIYMHNDQLNLIVNYDANPSYKQIFNNIPVSDNQGASWYSLEELKTSKLLTIDKMIVLVRYFSTDVESIGITIAQIVKDIYNFEYIGFDYIKVYSNLTDRQSNDDFTMCGVDGICAIESQNICITYITHAVYTAMINKDQKYMKVINEYFDELLTY